MKRKNTTLLSGIFVLAFILRIYKISSFPVGFTQDEAGIGYDAYSLLLTGKDMWGQAWPLILRSFGDFKMPLYSYIDIPFVILFGLTEFAVRLPSAILGSLAVVFTYLMVKEVSGNSRLAAVSSFLLAVSPWHMPLSRGAFEANLSVFFIPLAVWMFVKGLKNKRWMYVSALSFGLNLFSYHSARLFTPIVVALLIYFYWDQITRAKNGKKDIFGAINKYKGPLVVLITFVTVGLYTLFIGAGNRGLDIMIINPTDKWAAVADRRYEAVLDGLPDQVSRAFSNKLTYTWKIFVDNYLTYFSINYLFLSGAGEWSYGMIAGRGVLYLIELVFLISFFVGLSKGKSFRGVHFILLWLLLAPIPAAATKGVGSAGHRAAVMMPSIQIISAYGFLYLSDYFKELKLFKRRKNLIMPVFVLVMLFSLTFFLENYRYHAPVWGAKSMQYGVRETVEKMDEIGDDYEEILVSRGVSVPNIWIQFYGKVDPNEVQRTSNEWLKYEKVGLKYLDQLGRYELGKYTFADIVPSLKDKEPSILIMGKSDEFRLDVEAVHTTYYPGGKPAYLLVDSKNL